MIDATQAGVVRPDRDMHNVLSTVAEVIDKSNECSRVVAEHRAFRAQRAMCTETEIEAVAVRVVELLRDERTANDVVDANEMPTRWARCAWVPVRGLGLVASS